jgi:hypothetical protein
VAVSAPNWDAFDPERYLEHNYRQVLPPDRWLYLRLIADIRAAADRRGTSTPLRAADVGTGPNLYPVLATAPHVTAIDAAAPNRRYLLDQLDELDPVWGQWIALGREHASNVSGSTVQARMRVGATSILELPPRTYEIVTSFFCAESFTDDRKTFAAACERLVAAIRPEGLLAAAFMLGSTGYDTAGRDFPAVPIELADLDEVFTPLFTDVSIEPVPHGADVRAGYSGMAYVTGRCPATAE